MSAREVFFGKPSQEKIKGEYQPKKKLLKRALVNGMNARAFCLSCGKHFQVDEGRAQEILGEKGRLEEKQYIEVTGCGFCGKKIQGKGVIRER